MIRLLYKPIEDVKGISPAQLAAIFQSYPLAESILNLVNDFKSLLKAKKADELLLWMDKVALLGLPELDAFVNGLNRILSPLSMHLQLISATDSSRIPSTKLKSSNA